MFPVWCCYCLTLKQIRGDDSTAPVVLFRCRWDFFFGVASQDGEEKDWLGHINRDKWILTVLEGAVKGERRRRRNRLKFINCVIGLGYKVLGQDQLETTLPADETTYDDFDRILTELFTRTYFPPIYLSSKWSFSVSLVTHARTHANFWLWVINVYCVRYN